MNFRYTLRLEDGSDAGEVEVAQPANVGDEIRITGNARGRATAPWFRSRPSRSSSTVRSAASSKSSR